MVGKVRGVRRQVGQPFDYRGYVASGINNLSFAVCATFSVYEEKCRNLRGIVHNEKPFRINKSDSPRPTLDLQSDHIEQLSYRWRQRARRWAFYAGVGGPIR